LSSEEFKEFDWEAREAEVRDVLASDEAIVPEGELPHVLVDTPEAQRPTRPIEQRTRERIERRPIFPAWVRSVEELRHTVRWALRYAGHVAAFHAVRVPKYSGRLALRSPIGFWKVTRAVSRWASDAEGRPVRQFSVEQGDTQRYMQLSKQRDARVRARTFTLLVFGVPTLVSLGGFWVVSGPVTHGVTLILLAMFFGSFGGEADRPLLDVAVVKPEVAKLTSDVVRKALVNLGVSGLTDKMAERITFPAPIQRDGPGWRAEVDLPHGVTAAEIIEKRDKLASALRRLPGCVWPEVDPDNHAGRLILFVADHDLSRADQQPWPLLKRGSVDLFKPFPFGTDARARGVTLTLMFASMVIGSIPRQGKTAAMRLILLAAALDPTAELHIYDLKGTGDFAPLRPVTYRYRAGDDDAEGDIDYALADMREVQADLRRRAKVIRDLPPELCPESKITPKLARQRSLGLHPVVIGIDECQRWFEHDEHGAELAQIVDDLVRRGPAVGIMVIPTTQRPDAKSLPKGISANAVLRFCLKVMSHVENDMVLGGSAHRNGIRATMFSRKDLGIGYLAGEGDDPVITRTFYVDRRQADRVIERALEARKAAGTLAGYAIGEGPKTTGRPDDTLLEDALAVLRVGENKIANEDLLNRLAQRDQQAYGGWTLEQLTAALRAAGIDTREAQVWEQTDDGKGRNRRGVFRESIVAVLTLRGRNRDE
jgi:DNA segregation ATPase FtsK/SpoIIIE, S-DNA-T family